MLDVLEKQLETNQYIIGDEMSIVDFAIMPWIVCIDVIYQGSEIIELHSFERVNRWKERLLANPAIAKGMTICSY